MNIEQKIFKLINELQNQKNKKNKFIAGKTYIPVTQKFIDSKDIIYATKAVLDGWFTAGRFYKEFEESISNRLGLRARSLFVNSGSSANLLALSSLCQKNMLDELKINSLSEGDEVITAAAGFPTTINPIFQNAIAEMMVTID